MTLSFKNIKDVGSILTKGAVLKFAPDIVMGALKAYFKGRHLDVEKASAWVLENKNLWESIGPQYQKQLSMAAKRIRNLDFLNAEWAIEGLKEDFPALASLFLGWQKGRNWLERQLQNIKIQSLK